MSKSRASRRNAYHDLPRKVRKDHPWRGMTAAKVMAAPPVKPNKRDRSIEREEHITMDFTGPQGLALAQITHKASTLFLGKPKRGWAAKRRARPFAEYFAGQPDKLHNARMRHAWYRKHVGVESGIAAIVGEAA